jgi:hypothetical protein
MYVRAASVPARPHRDEEMGEPQRARGRSTYYYYDHTGAKTKAVEQASMQAAISLFCSTLRELVLRFDGYECKEPEPGKFTLAFSQLEDALLFAQMAPEMVVIVLGAAVGGVVAWKATRPEVVVAPPRPIDPIEAAKREPVVMVPTVITPAEVRFEIDSQPQGASVTRDGVSLGVTPLSFTLPRQDNAALQVELAFALEGYETQSVVAQGTDVVTINQTLNRKPSVRPLTRPTRKPKNPTTEPNGYKDDPY